MSDESVRVRVAGGEFRYDREHYERGDELDVHEDALEKHPRTLERVAGTAGTAEDPTPAPESETADEQDFEVVPDDVDPHPSDLTIDELEERIADVDDVGLLKAIRELEVESDGRKGAKEAIDDRLDELEA